VASQEEINEVRDMLGSNSEADGWSDTKIGDLLDVGDSAISIARRYWESAMAESTHLADVDESGSSRKLSQIFKNKAAMAAYFRGAEQAEDPENQPGNPSFSREIRRV